MYFFYTKNFKEDLMTSHFPLKIPAQLTNFFPVTILVVATKSSVKNSSNI